MYRTDGGKSIRDTLAWQYLAVHGTPRVGEHPDMPWRTWRASVRRSARYLGQLVSWRAAGREAGPVGRSVVCARAGQLGGAMGLAVLPRAAARTRPGRPSRRRAGDACHGRSAARAECVERPAPGWGLARAAKWRMTSSTRKSLLHFGGGCNKFLHFLLKKCFVETQRVTAGKEECERYLLHKTFFYANLRPVK